MAQNWEASALDHLINSHSVDISKDFFALSWGERVLLIQMCKVYGYKYSGNSGRSIIRNFWYSMQRLHVKQMAGVK